MNNAVEYRLKEQPPPPPPPLSAQQCLCTEHGRQKEKGEKAIVAKMANTQATLYVCVCFTFDIDFIVIAVFALAFFYSFNFAKLIRSLNGSIIASDLLHVHRTM